MMHSDTDLKGELQGSDLVCAHVQHLGQAVMYLWIHIFQVCQCGLVPQQLSVQAHSTCSRCRQLDFAWSQCMMWQYCTPWRSYSYFNQICRTSLV